MKNREKDALRLVEYLREFDYIDGSRWHTGESIRAKQCWSERRLRDAAEASDGRVLSAPGCSLGYRLAEGCDVKEYQKEVRVRYLSQVKRMQERLAKMDGQFQFPPL